MSYDLGTAHGQIEISYDGHPAVREAKDDIKKLSISTHDGDKDLKKFGQTLGKVAGAFGKGVAFLGAATALTNMGVAAGAASVQILGMVPALASIGALAAGLPGILVGAAGGVIGLKVALAGVGDALKLAFTTKDAKKFEESLKGLSPQAAAFAKAFKSDLVPALGQFQKRIQSALFSTKLQSFFPAIRSALVSLTSPMQEVVRQFASMAKGVANFALSAKTLQFVRDSLGNFRDGLKTIAPAITPVLTGLRDVGQVGLPLMKELSGLIASVGEQFGAFLSRIAKSGELAAWIQQGESTLSTLASTIGNIGSILASVFGAAQQSGGGLLNTLEMLTGQLSTFLNSAEGNALLNQVFTALLTTAHQLAPVVGTLVKALGGALAPVLQSLATQIGPVLLQTVNQLAPAFAPLAQGILDVLKAVVPILPPLAKFIGLLAQALGAGLSELATEFGPIVSVLGDAFLSALTQLQPVLEQFISQGMPQAAALGVKMAEAFAPLAPVIVQLAQAFVNFILPVLPTIIELFTNITNVMAAVVPAFVGVLGVGLKLATFFVNFGSSVVGALRSVGPAFEAFKASVGTAITNAYNAVVTTGQSIVSWFIALPGRIGAALVALPGIIVALVKSAVSNAAFAFGAGIGTVVSLAVAAPGRIKAGFFALVDGIRSVVSNAWSAAKSAFSAGVAAIVGFATNAPPRIAGALASLPGLLRSAASSALAAMRGAFSAGINAVAGLARTIGPRVRSGIGNLGALLVSAGRDAVAGLVSGLRGAIGAAVSAAASVGQSVIDGIKSTLKISSPSKVTEQLASFAGQGLVRGLQGSASQVRSAAAKLAGIVRDAFSDKLISGGTRNRLLSSITNANAKLQRLVGQSVAVAAKLKNAQASLKSVQDAYNKAASDAQTNVLQTFQLVNPGQTFVNIDALKARLASTVKVAQQFAADMAALAKRGLNRDFLSQLADAGAAQGSAMAHALAGASDGDIKQLNALQGQLNAAAGTVGKSVADALYGAGVRAAQGLVRGLQSQQKAIDKQMATIAVGLANQIKRALKIKSPSRVMFDLGKFTGMGLLNGLLSLVGKVRDAATQLASSAVAPSLGFSTSRSASTSPSVQNAIPVVGTGFTVNQTVNALPGMSARQVSDYSATKLNLLARAGTIAVATTAPRSQEA